MPSEPVRKPGKQRMTRTESQKKRTAAKAAETRARNKAAKAAQLGARPNDTCNPVSNPPAGLQSTPSENENHDSAQPPPNQNVSNSSQAGAASRPPPVSTLPLRPVPRLNAPPPTPPPQPASASTWQSPSPSPPPGDEPHPSGSGGAHGPPPGDEPHPRGSGGAHAIRASSSSNTTARRVREKKLVPYRTYDPKEALGLAGDENKLRWQFLRDTIRGLLRAQKFQAAQSWTKHSLTQRAVVVTEAQKELTKQVTADPEWGRVIRQPMLPQVIEDIAKDCCNNSNSYKSQKQKKYGRG